MGSCVYTDGSKIGSNAGAGIFSSDFDFDIAIPLGELTTVFQAEVFALLTSAALLNDRNVQGLSITFLSDSQAAIRAVSGNIKDSLLVLEGCSTLNKLSAHNNILLLWVPGHSDREGNIRADELAKSGARSLLYGPLPLFGISNKCRRALVLRNVNKAHQARWSNSQTGLHTKLFAGGPNRTLTRTLMEYSRPKIGTFINIVTGHCFNKHMFKLGIVNSPICRYCLEDDETVSHILCECLALVSDRVSTFGVEHIEIGDMAKSKMKLLFHFVEKYLHPEADT